MDPLLVDFAWLIGSFVFGIMLGCMTGLIPGFHVNNVALIALSLSPLAVGAGIPLDAVAGTIVATGTVHTFLNYIPSALIGAPDGDTALALLPGHRMLISGQAAQGVAYSARGSQMGMFLSIPLLIVARLLFGTNPGLGLFEASRSILPYLLLIISTFLILTETTRLPWPQWMQKVTSWMRWEFPKPIEFTIPFGYGSIHRRYEALDLRLGNASRAVGMLAATAFFLLSGFYGWAVFELPARSPVGMPSATLLMPGLAGLFGIANLVDIYLTTSEMPPQEPNWDMPPMKPLLVPTFLSAICSSVMAILPGMTAAQATVVVMSVRNLWGRLTDPNYIPADFEYGPGMGGYEERAAAFAASEAGASFGEATKSRDTAETALAVSAAAVAATAIATKSVMASSTPSTVELSVKHGEMSELGEGELGPFDSGTDSSIKNGKKANWKKVVLAILPILLLLDAKRAYSYVCSDVPFGNPITIEGVSIQPTREVCSNVAGQTSIGLGAEFQIVLVIGLLALAVTLHFLQFSKLLARRFVTPDWIEPAPSTIDHGLESEGVGGIEDGLELAAELAVGQSTESAVLTDKSPPILTSGKLSGAAAAVAAGVGTMSASGIYVPPPPASGGGLNAPDLTDTDLAIFESAKGEAIEAAEISPDLDLDATSHKQDLEVIAVLSSVNTSVTVMVLGFLYMVGRPRSGAALALNMMYPIDIWGSYEPPPDFIRLLAITIGSGLIAVPVMMKVGKGMLKLHEMIPLRSLVGSVILFVTALVWFSTGWIGVGVLIIGTVMGLMPPRIGIRRSHGMGIILVPIMLYTFAQQLDGFGFI
jgi:TctA family transporter